ncbi:MAG: 1-acyl-sn-glycerol-3-phosphate acyltransferase, partial [Chitinophagales bacterium]
MPKHKPTILVSNHPNTMMDVLTTSMQLPQQVYFIARHTLFGTSKLQKAWCEEGCNMIPIYRPHEVSKSDLLKNRGSFSRVYERLKEGKTILVFPQGHSYLEEFEVKFKTGAARMLLEGEAVNDYKVGINLAISHVHYFSPRFFQSDVLIEIAPPIDLQPYLTLYQTNKSKAAKQLTKTIGNTMHSIGVFAKSRIDFLIFKRLESVIQPTLAKNKGIKAKNLEGRKELGQKLMAQFNAQKETHPEEFDHLGKTVNAYEARKRAYRIGETAMRHRVEKKSLFWRMLLLLLTLPIFLFGVLVNGLPAWMGRKISFAITVWREYESSIKLGFGVLLYPLLYTILSFVAVRFLPSIFATWWTIPLLILSFLASGYFAFYYLEAAKTVGQRIKLLFSKTQANA